MKIIIREFERERDIAQVEEVERMCEVGPTSTVSIFTHLLGDPLCRIRHSPAFLMLVNVSFINFYFYYYRNNKNNVFK